jgi:hypothetical protein
VREQEQDPDATRYPGGEPAQSFGEAPGPAAYRGPGGDGGGGSGGTGSFGDAPGGTGSFGDAPGRTPAGRTPAGRTPAGGGTGRGISMPVVAGIIAVLAILAAIIGFAVK